MSAAIRSAQERHLDDARATEAWGARLAGALSGGLVVTLSGDLGAGKTTLVRGLLRATGVRGAIKSPTYALVEVYEVPNLYFYHFDLYRLRSPDELDEIGFPDYVRPDSVCLIEWPERAAGRLPPPDLAIALSFAGDGRSLCAEPLSERGRECLARMGVDRGEEP